MKIKLIVALMLCISTTQSFEPISSLVGIGALAKHAVDLYNATGNLATAKRALEQQSINYQLALHLVKMNFFECLSNNKESDKAENGFPIVCEKRIAEFEQLAGFEEVNKQRMAFKALCCLN